MGFISVPQSTNHSFGSTVNLWFFRILTLSIINPDECCFVTQGLRSKKHKFAANDHSYFSEKYPWIKRKGGAIAVYSPVVISTFNALTGVVDWRNGCQRWFIIHLSGWNFVSETTARTKSPLDLCELPYRESRHSSCNIVFLPATSLAEIHPIDEKKQLHAQTASHPHKVSSSRLTYNLSASQVVELSPSP